MSTSLKLPPLSLYIHIPWCIRKCPYCDFNSHVSPTQIPEAEYIQALLADFNAQRDYIQGRKLHSIFIGGGTPSLFSAQSMDKLLTNIQAIIDFDTDIEITLEANPGTAEQQKFSDFRLAGINRLSIGVQSFSSQQLTNLGRVHGRHEALFAAEAAHKAGFTNFNLDLMHGLTGQTAQQALEDLQQAIDLKPTHISWYQLTIEPNTAFYTNPPPIPNDDQLADIQLAGESLLANSHYTQYEVSAYSQPNLRSIHNMNYWQFGDYIGIGAGAHGKITQLDSQHVLRQWQTRSPKDYLAKTNDFTAGSKVIPTDDLPLEFMMNSLRLSQGFHPDLFTERTGLSLSSLDKVLKTLSDKSLLLVSHKQITTTDLGKRFLNEVLAAF